MAEGSPGKVPAASVGELRGTETVLIAEDHESVREMARQALLSLGYRVLSAADGEEALRLCAEDTPAIAILDVIMPKLGGVATAQKLTANFRGLPVIFTSGYSQDSENVGARPRTHITCKNRTAPWRWGGRCGKSQQSEFASALPSPVSSTPDQRA